MEGNIIAVNLRSGLSDSYHKGRICCRILLLVKSRRGAQSGVLIRLDQRPQIPANVANNIS